MSRMGVIGSWSALALAGAVWAGCTSHAPTRGTGAGEATAGVGTVYRFAHVRTGARRLRGGSFPGDVPLNPLMPAGVTKLPTGADLRVGRVRVPGSLLGAGAGDGTALNVRALVIDDPPGATGSIPFWLDADGDGDPTNDEVIPDAAPRSFALSNSQMARALTRLGTGTIRIGPERHAYVSGRVPGTDSMYVFVAADAVREDRPNEFAWDRALGLCLEAAPQIRELPAGVDRGQALGGELRIGPREVPGRFLVLLDLSPGREPRLYIDRDSDGGLDEEAVALARGGAPRAPGSRESPARRWTGTATLRVVYPAGDGLPSDAESLDVSLELRMGADGSFTTEDVAIIYRGEWGRTGRVSIAGKDHAALLFDELASGDYRGSMGGNDSGVRLLIDLNDDGKFERGEVFDPSKEFIADGVRCQVEGMEASGASFRLIEVGALGGS